MQVTHYLSDAQLAARYSVHRVTIWRWARTGRFPQPIKLTPGTSRWRLEDVVQYEREVAGVAQ
jgi:predicted DNA-binding transcriptional regulator AlpA